MKKERVKEYEGEEEDGVTMFTRQRETCCLVEAKMQAHKVAAKAVN